MVSPDKFRQIASHWLSGVAVVTSIGADGKPVGMTMSAVTSLSLEPMQFLICVDNRARTLAAISSSRSFCINYLREDQEPVAVAFARSGDNKFTSFPHHFGDTGAPVLDDTVAFVECTLEAIHPGGDHSIVVGNAVHGETFGGDPLGYHRGNYRRLPKTTLAGNDNQMW
ncbi:MAG TPA: flavin reductase family protein [Bryobacteraceae bacterium]